MGYLGQSVKWFTGKGCTGWEWGTVIAEDGDILVIESRAGLTVEMIAHEVRLMA